MDGIVSQQVRKGRSICNVIDSNNIETTLIDHSTKNQSTNPAEAVDRNIDSHSKTSRKENEMCEEVRKKTEKAPENPPKTIKMYQEGL
jgi:hypothetical protein